MEIELTVNGETERVRGRDGKDLATALREAGYRGVRCGCDGGDCGVSTILVDGEPVMACGTTPSKVSGTEIETIEGLGSQDDLHPLQEAFVDHFAVQCGYCTPAFILAGKALLDEEPDPTERQVRAAIDDTICRCTGYQKPVEAIMAAAETMNEDDSIATDGGRSVETADPTDGTRTPEGEVMADE